MENAQENCGVRPPARISGWGYSVTGQTLMGVREMSEIKNHVGVPIHDAIMDIIEQIQLLHKRIDDLKEEFSMLRAGKGENK